MRSNPPQSCHGTGLHALPALPTGLCQEGELAELALRPLPDPVWREAVAGGWCRTFCCHELDTCVLRECVSDLVASPFPVPLRACQLFSLQEYIAIRLKLFLLLKLSTYLQQNPTVFYQSKN